MQIPFHNRAADVSASQFDGKAHANGAATHNHYLHATNRLLLIGLLLLSQTHVFDSLSLLLWRSGRRAGK
jgi:hypothetical protein